MIVSSVRQTPGRRSAWRDAALALSAILTAAAVLRRAENPANLALLAVASTTLLLLAISDVRTLRLPNRLMAPGIAAAVLAAGLWPDHSAASALVGGAAGFAAMLAVYLLLPGFGAGDVKLCALIGLLTGWPQLWSALLLGVCVNGGFALLALLAGRRTAMPYGPGLIVGALIVLLR